MFMFMLNTLGLRLVRINLMSFIDCCQKRVHSISFSPRAAGGQRPLPNFRAKHYTAYRQYLPLAHNVCAFAVKYD